MSSNDVDRGQVRGRKRRALRKQLLKILDAVDGDDDDEDDDDALTNEDTISRIFDKIDIDSDGILTRSELESSGLQVGGLGQIDINRDGSISRKEFDQAVRLLEGRLDTPSATSDGQQAIVDELEDTLGDLEPLERQELRLGGFEPYILVSVLTAQASFEEIGNTNVKWDTLLHVSSLMDLAKPDWYFAAVLLSAAGATVSGLYSTIVFSLTILYGKTALGMDRDDDYYGFMDNTGLQRFRAFQAFTTSLSLFTTSVLLEVCVKVPDIARLPFAAASAGFLYFAKQEYEKIMAAAAPMFAPKKTKAPKESKVEVNTNGTSNGDDASSATNGGVTSSTVGEKSIIDNDDDGNVGKSESDLSNPDECYLDDYDPDTGKCEKKTTRRKKGPNEKQ